MRRGPPAHVKVTGCMLRQRTRRMFTYLVSWRDRRSWLRVRSGIKSSLTRRLNGEVLNRDKWFSRSASRKRVRDKKHFDYLMHCYLPAHGGIKWFEDHGRIE